MDCPKFLPNVNFCNHGSGLSGSGIFLLAGMLNVLPILGLTIFCNHDGSLSGSGVFLLAGMLNVLPILGLTIFCNHDGSLRKGGIVLLAGSNHGSGLSGSGIVLLAGSNHGSGLSGSGIFLLAGMLNVLPILGLTIFCNHGSGLSGSGVFLLAGMLNALPILVLTIFCNHVGSLCKGGIKFLCVAIFLKLFLLTGVLNAAFTWEDPHAKIIAQQTLLILLVNLTMKHTFFKDFPIIKHLNSKFAFEDHGWNTNIVFL